MTLGGLIPGGLVLDGVVLLSMLAICLFALLTVMFLVVRLPGLRQRGDEQLSLDALSAEVAKQQQRNADLLSEQEDIRSAEELLERISNDQVETLKPYNERLLDELRQVRDEIEAARAELAELEAVREGARDDITAQTAKLKALEDMGNAWNAFPDGALAVSVKEMPGGAKERSDSDRLGAFRIMPECLLGFDDARQVLEEDQLLEEFGTALNESGLQYPKQIVRAFHTALKVNDLSPLTVLSGLSGTGKSQLPRAYARFFGIHFLHVPVEPGWDSPQDLLGFYDFVAERYRPTDRARALGHFDRRFAVDIGIEQDRGWDDRMLIILLDEMNLARTEYYFSEFLSRLEMRGPRINGGSETEGSGESMIAIDLPYAENERPKHLFVPHNVLWAGTLNEDETTQALSDKVLDRANSIRFAPPDPGTLNARSTAPETRIREADGYLPYGQWLQWSGRRTMREGSDEVGETLKRLATLMQKAGRGFGYRIAQSIRAYVERYPGSDWRDPMIDQINMRLLPKLAGAETASAATQIFTWPGWTYEGTER